jgi:ribonuclease PH
VDGEALVDLCYEEDSVADVDMNVVMNGNGDMIEVQATAEGESFSREQLEELLDLAADGINALVQVQKEHV